MKKRFAALFILLVLIAAGGVLAGEGVTMSFENPVITEGAEGSLVKQVETAVIIPGDAHDDLWVHPNLVTMPGEPIRFEMALRSTDRVGHDKHTRFNYFATDDDFKTLRPLDKPTAPAWARIGLTSGDIDWAAGDIPEPKRTNWHWARNSTHLSKQVVVYPFLVKDGKNHSVRTVAARRDGDKLVPLYVSNALENRAKRGLLEPQMVRRGERLYMTMRAEDGFGYVAVSDDDARSWQKAQAWIWDDGKKVALESTMTKLLAHSAGLLLVYTRPRRDNRNVMRGRAPLFCADVDPETLALKRATERILVPNKGLPIGNFWVWPVDERRSYVVVAEWPRDNRARNGDTYLAKITWTTPNQQMTPDGTERVALDASANRSTQ